MGRLHACSRAGVLFYVIALTGIANAEASPSKLVCSPCSVNFGTVRVGETKTIGITLKNSGTKGIRIFSKTKTDVPWVSSRGLVLRYWLGAGKSVSFQLVYAPQDRSTVNGIFRYHSDASNPSLAIHVSGAASATTRGVLAPNPVNVPFGSVQVGQTATKYQVLRNSGTSSLTVSRVTATGRGFSVAGISLPLTLAPGHSVTFQTNFRPSARGWVTGLISIESTAKNSTLSVPESGTGTSSGALGISPGAMNFGSITVGSQKILAGTLTASGANLTVKSASVSSNEYSISGLAFPLMLRSGQSVPFKVIFAPKTSGVADATLSFATGTTMSSARASLQGAGTAPSHHFVALSWRASISQVVGYNVYRGTRSGGPFSLINSSPEASTMYSDHSVNNGTTYYYVVTSVNSKGAESVFSNQASAVVPSR